MMSDFGFIVNEAYECYAVFVDIVFVKGDDCHINTAKEAIKLAISNMVLVLLSPDCPDEHRSYYNQVFNALVKLEHYTY